MPTSIAPLFVSNHDHLVAYCDRCERWFPHDQALRQHKENSSSHWFCHHCGLDFASWTGLQQHYIQSPNHHYCRECNTLFDSEGSRARHMEAKHWYCRMHDKVSIYRPHYFLFESAGTDGARTVGLQVQRWSPIALRAELRSLRLPSLELPQGQ